MGTSVGMVASNYEAFNRGDVAAVMATFSPGIEWRTPPSLPWSTGTYCGPDEVARYFQAFGEALQDARVDPELVEGTGKVVVVRGFERGTVRSTGRRFDARFVHVWTVEDDRVVAMEGVVDTAVIVAASAP